jgi:phenylalanyl-tRNA synthetase beta chain
MKFTLSWLKEFIDTHASLDEISTKLTAVGLEIDGIEDPSKALKGFVVGHVLECEKHPDADKLRCLIVDTGTEKLKVVCGAPNVRQGMKSVFAPVGSVMPVSGITLKKSLIRGQESNGMMCGPDELMPTETSHGIVELPDSAVVGSSAAAALGLDDPVIEINLTPNRGDCAGILGIARDLAAAGLGQLKPLAQAPEMKQGFKNPVSIRLEDTQACPLFIGVYIKGVKNAPAPKWMQDRLKSIGLRPISALVDITNYITIALNRPLHVFDADKLKGDLHVRLSKKGETLAALNDKSYELDDGMIVVCDDSGVLCLGGIMGGASTAVDEHTQNVYLEIAYFDPTRTAKTGQKLQISSDARYRFERGIDPAFMQTGAQIATRMILDLCGGEASAPFVVGAAPDLTKTISYDPQRVKTLGGSDVPEAQQKEILTALGFDVLADWKVKTPSWRHDVEGVADIVEEVLRIRGYDNIPAEYVVKTPGEKQGTLSPLQKRVATVRRMLAARGMNETVTWSFMEDSKADLFGANDTQQKKALTLLNPISADLAVMRPSILPNLIEAAGRSVDRGIPDAGLFEIGNIYKSPEASGQLAVAAGVRSGNAVPRHWSGAARAVDALDAKADALAVLETCGINVSGVQITTDAPEWYHPGRSGVLRQGAAVLASFGEIHPSVMEKLKRDEVCVGFEVLLQNVPLPRKKGPRRDLLKPSSFQPVLRDFAFIVDEELEVEKLMRAVRGAEKALVSAVDIFDVYMGKGVTPGKKSVALSVTIQPVEKTLTDEEINLLSQKIIEQVQKQTGGVLRS